MANVDEIKQAIGAVGDKIRDLKASKASKEEITTHVQELLALKAKYKEVSGEDFQPPKVEKKKKEKVVQAAVDPNKKTKKQLNKEKKKAAKQESKKDPKVEAKKTTAKAAPLPCQIDFKALRMPSCDKLDNPQVFYSNESQPVCSYIVATLFDQTKWFSPTPSCNAQPVLVFPDGRYINGDFTIARYLAREQQSSGLYGFDNVSTCQIDSWMDYALNFSPVKAAPFLNEYLATRSFLVGYAFTLADIAMWVKLKSTKYQSNGQFKHLDRWLAHCSSQGPFTNSLQVLQKTVKSSAASAKSNSTGSCPPLEGAVVGQVVTRFPPEPSGYLHIGHVKACMLNHYYARHYQGKLIVRFDDTNPSKEKAEFEESILSDLKRLNIEADVVTYTSDHFELIYKLAKQMIQEGNAYMDNTSQEQMRQERMDGINSKHREMTPKETMKLFEAMCKGDKSAEGYCLRAKIDMQAKNKTLRDPVLYRSNATAHNRTGTKYKAYPTYDFACPIVDSVEGVTHAMRTTEYNDRDFQYAWIIDALKLRPVKIQSFARMNFVHSVLSKRKLQWFVDNHHVSGWDDPRFPTVQGVLRRGVQVEALRDFILSQGASRRIVDMEWDKFWTMNKRVIDPIAPRFTAIMKDNAIKVTLTNISETDGVSGRPVALHPKNPEMGNKIVRFCRHLLIEKDDANAIEDKEEVTLMRYGNIIVEKIERDAKGQVSHIEALANPKGDFKKTKKKITWLADVDDLVTTKLVEFDHLLSKPKLEEGDDFHDFLTPVTRAETIALGDHGLRNLQHNQVIQLERRGYFRVDQPYVSATNPLVLFMIPDGKVKAMSTLSTKLAHR